MTGTDEPRCGHTYTTHGQRTFVCAALPHPNKPDAHYFVRQPGDPNPPQRRRGLVVIPGQRDDR